MDFWSPSSKPLRALQPGEMLLFKLHAPDNFIVGGGFFTRFLRLPIQLERDPIRLTMGCRFFEALPWSAARNPRLRFAPPGATVCRRFATPNKHAWSRTVRGKTYDTGKGEHDLRNGLLLRSDLHRLFDQGYLSVDPADRRILVSRRIREEFENGKDYYRLNGRLLRPPVMNEAVPGGEYLAYHAENVFR